MTCRCHWDHRIIGVRATPLIPTLARFTGIRLSTVEVCSDHAAHNFSLVTPKTGIPLNFSRGHFHIEDPGKGRSQGSRNIAWVVFGSNSSTIFKWTIAQFHCNGFYPKYCSRMTGSIGKLSAYGNTAH
jgi:hypothetical protein